MIVDSIFEAMNQRDAAKIAALIANADFTLIETPEDSADDGKAALSVEVDGYPAIVAFTSEDYASIYVDEEPDLLESDGTVPAFVVGGTDFLAFLSDGFGAILNPHSDNCVVLPPNLIAQVKRFLSP